MNGTVTQTIRLSPADNVVVARAALRADTRVEEEALTTLDSIDPGHKVATQAIAKGDTIRKYDQIIGIAESDIQPGQHVHTHNLRMDDFDRDYRFSESVRSLDFVTPEQAATFEGMFVLMAVLAPATTSVSSPVSIALQALLDMSPDAFKKM